MNNEQLIRREEICTQLKNLRKQRDDSPLTVDDKINMTDNYQMHLEASTRINELQQELALLEGDKVV